MIQREHSPQNNGWKMVGHLFEVGALLQTHWLTHWKCTISYHTELDFTWSYTKVGWKMTCDRPLFHYFELWSTTIVLH